MKQLVFRTISTLMFFAVTFLLIFMLTASKFSTYNAALAFCVLIALCLSIAYFLFRGIRQRKEAERECTKRADQDALHALLLTAEDEFSALMVRLFIRHEHTVLRPRTQLLYFPESGRCICWVRNTSPAGSDALLPLLRTIKKLGAKSTTICTLNGLDASCLSFLPNCATLLNGNDLLYKLRCANIEIKTEPSAAAPPLRKRFMQFTLQKGAAKKCFRYGLWLACLAWLTPFKHYYLLFSALLCFFSLFLTVHNARQSKKMR